MQVMKIVKQLAKFSKSFIKEEIEAFFKPDIDYRGYVIVAESFEIQTNKPNQYIIKGVIFKQLDSINTVEEDKSFSFLGESFVKDDDFITFNSKKLQVIEIQQNVEQEFALSTTFEAKITIEEEAIGNIKMLDININKEKTIKIEINGGK